MVEKIALFYIFINNTQQDNWLNLMYNLIWICVVYKEKKENENPPQNPNPNPPQSEENTQVVPKQDENNKPPENQPVNEPPKQEQAKQNDEIQEIEGAKPEIKAKDNRMKFTHPMNDYCSPESVKEIESCPQDKLFPIISKRLNGIV